MTSVKRKHQQSVREAVGKKREQPIDPASGGKSALRGRIVTMNDALDVIADGVIYIEQENIVAVRDASAASPAGFEEIPIIPSRPPRCFR